ncbi:MAG: DUF2752 domain-containing protein [Oscillospiraceae bacterium]|nr:DUF2752 domain-containing protein [Oscillospiraceae bacterium]
MAKNLFGVRCFGCGLSRGMIALLHGQWRLATQYHILSIPIAGAFAIYAIKTAYEIIFK